MFSIRFFVLTLGLVACSATATADVGLLLLEPTGQGMSRFTSAGHAEVYFSRICPETPVSARFCREGESGSVLSNYTSLGEDRPYEWNLTPLPIRLYGVDKEDEKPLFVSSPLLRFLQDRYRSRYLAEICTSAECLSGKNDHWRDLVGAAFSRSVYLFEVKTTVEQDQKMIEFLNSSPNVNRYNGFTRNCADFTARITNMYFPHAAKADHLNDFGMTSPKAIAKSFVHYAGANPDLHLRVRLFRQIPSHIPRSGDFRKGTEVSFRAKKWLFPMLLRSHELALFALSYSLTGRFNPRKELERHPDETDPKTAALASSEVWKEYAKKLSEYSPVLKDADARLRKLETAGAPYVADDGSLAVRWNDAGRQERVAVSASNAIPAAGDAQTIYRLLLARTALVLKQPRRESPALMEEDLELLEKARASMITHGLD